MKRCFCGKLLCVGMFSVRIHMFYSVRKCLDRESLCDDVFFTEMFCVEIFYAVNFSV